MSVIAHHQSRTRAVRRTPSGSRSSLLKAEELSSIKGWVDGLRSEVGLPPKDSGVSSNFIHETRGEEIAHILRNELEDVLKELDEGGAFAEAAAEAFLRSGSRALSLR